MDSSPSQHNLTRAVCRWIGAQVEVVHVFAEAHCPPLPIHSVALRRETVGVPAAAPSICVGLPAVENPRSGCVHGVEALSGYFEFSEVFVFLRSCAR